MSKELRKFIRSIILEGLPAREKEIRRQKRQKRLQKKKHKGNRVRRGVSDSLDGKTDSPVDLKLDDSGASADQRAIGGIKNKYGPAERLLTREQQMDHAITHMPEYQQSQNLRAVIKRWWNDRVYGNSVRRAYFTNPNNIRCIHWLGFYDENPEVAVSKLDSYLGRDSKRDPELSCIGYTEDRAIWRYDKSIGIEYKKRSITFAYQWDAHTEFLSSATPEIHELHRGSGVHKRPNTHINIWNVIFDERDIERMNLKRINECIIDNYDHSPENVIIHVNPELSDEIKEKIEKIIKSYSENYIIKYK